jgi:NADH:ubiquinone oxidoreductase subunit 6 (subunit J)
MTLAAVELLHVLQEFTYAQILFTFNLKVVALINVWYKEVKTQLVYYLLTALLIKRHVSAYSEAIIRFNNC